MGVENGDKPRHYLQLNCHKMKSLFLLISIIFIIGTSGFAEEEEKFVYDAKGKRDPFVPAELAKEKRTGVMGKIEDLSLEGIIWVRRGGSVAIISGEIVKAGDEIMGFKVVRVERTRVILSREEDEYRLIMEEETSD